MQVSRPEIRLKRDSRTGIFLWISHIFSKSLIYWTLSDDCFCWFPHSNQRFITLLWSHLFRLFLHVFPFIIDIVGNSSLPFLRHPPLYPACPLFKIFVCPSLFSLPSPFKVFQTVPPTLTQPLLVLIWPTNILWFKQISKEQFYRFNCHFLSKMNFNLLNPFANRYLHLWDIFRFIFRQLRMTFSLKLWWQKRIIFL